VIFLDTSALVKRYAEERGTDLVRRYMSQDLEWAASALARAETAVTLCHLGAEGRYGSPSQRHLEADWNRFLVVPLDAECLSAAATIGCRHKVRTLDAIHLAAASRLPPQVTFISFDRRQSDAARALGLEVVAT
jgi:hypothetical protein